MVRKSQRAVFPMALWAFLAGVKVREALVVPLLAKLCMILAFSEQVRQFPEITPSLSKELLFLIGPDGIHGPQLCSVKRLRMVVHYRFSKRLETEKILSSLGITTEARVLLIISTSGNLEYLSITTSK